MASQGEEERAEAVRQALGFLHESAGRFALVELSYGEWVLARFRMTIEEAEAEDGLLTVLGDVEEYGEALLYSEVNLPLSHEGVYDLSVAGNELRLSSDDGMRLSVTRLA